MVVIVTVDNREKEFVKTFSGRDDYKFENMAIGDFKFNDSVYIERKTFSDMATSIKDGRYREQKIRLKTLIGVQIIYLIENDGNLRNGTVCGLPASTIMGAMTKCMLRDGFFIYQSGGIEESVKFIEKIKKQMENGELGGAGGAGVGGAGGAGVGGAGGAGVGYVNVIKTEKKANMTEGMCYLAQLKQIPGVSSGGALAIKEKYSSMKAIFDGYRYFDVLENDNLSCVDRLKAKKLMLSEIKIGGRRLGKKTSEKIYRYLCCDE